MLPYALQKRLYPIAIHDICWLNLRFEHQALRIHEQMTLSSLNLLAAIVPALSSYAGSLHRLAIHYARARGSMFRPIRARKRSRSAACSFSQVPSMHQVLK